MFRYHFLRHFLAELNEICCGSLLNSIRILCVFFTQNMIKTVLCKKSKNASVSVLICVSSMCVQLFTAVEEAVLKFYVPW